VTNDFRIGRDLDTRRHRLIVDRLSLKIAQAQDAVLAIEPHIDTKSLLDRDYVSGRRDEHAPPGRRELLRLA
jgi:hypothetical protein